MESLVVSFLVVSVSSPSADKVRTGATARLMFFALNAFHSIVKQFSHGVSE